MKAEMTKNEIRAIASKYGHEAHYRGHITDDDPQRWYYTPLLLNVLNELLPRQEAKLKLAIGCDATLDQLNKLRADIETTKENIKNALIKKEQFEALNLPIQ